MLISQPYNNTAGQTGRTQNTAAQKPNPMKDMKMTGESVMPYSRTTPNISSVPNMSSMPNMTTAPMTGTGVSPMSNAPMTGTGVSPMSNKGMYPEAGTQMMGMTPATRRGSMPGTAGSSTSTPMQGLPARPTVTSSAGVNTPTTVESPYYTAGFLRNFLGKNMRVEFLIGTSGALVDRVGVLVEVGASYIVLRPYLTDDLLMCDLYSIKFVTIYG